MGLRIRFQGDEQINRDRIHTVQYRRTMSYNYASEDDIDIRAEIFIANFRRQLSLERRVSWEPRYCARDCFESD